MQHRCSRQSLLLQCIFISLFLLFVLLKNILVSNSAVSTGQCYHNIIETFTVSTRLLENLCMLKSNWQLSIILQWQAMCIMWIVALKCRCWTSFIGFARKFLNKSLNVTAFSTMAMTMQKCQMCQSFLCHRLSEPSFEPFLKNRQNESLHHSVISIDSIIIGDKK